MTAPPGYGKSTLLAQWAQVEERQVAWVSLDRLDDDAAVLLTLLATAYVRATQHRPDVVADMAAVGFSALGRAAPLLATVVNASPMPFVLMLDDLHELRSPATHDVLGLVASAIPAGSQLVTASRDEQPHLPRLRASGDAMELTRSDLAFGATGAKQVFGTAGVDLSEDDAEDLVSRTEGWPAGLYLSALVARDRPESIAQISGEDRYIADYLYRETLSKLDEDVRELLRRTSVLDLLSGPLCDAVLGRHDSQSRLRGLEASTQFVFAVDRNRQWYRCHAMFREFLVGQLHLVEPEIVADLHVRAADWYEKNGSPELAVEHLLQTDDCRRAAELVAKAALPTYRSGQLATVRRWFATLGDDGVEEYPPLAVLRAWLAAATGATEEALRWLAHADGVEFDGPQVDGTASFESARAMLRVAMCPDGPGRAMRDAQLAVEQEAPWSDWRDRALYLYGEATLLAGDEPSAVALLEDAAAAALRRGNAEVMVLSETELAWLAMNHGHWEDAARRVESVMVAVDKHRLLDSVASLLAHGVAARSALHGGDRASAERLHRQAMRGRTRCTYALPFLSVRGRLQLAEVSLAAGDPGTTRHLLTEIDEILRHRPSLGALVDEVETLRSIAAPALDASAAGTAPLTPAELRLLPYLQTHLTVAEIGKRLFISRNTASSEIASIYRKLGASSRGRAVEKAIAIGLLGE
ncbi:MAG TPA: LuxR C-terminal-related transcriptional regulator [Nocardioides sp.]